ncbi:MAG: phosphoribosyl-AMP cyclohydrolase [Betaproteobacteria bacterium HGW-Betaproteobacteria-13]|nr:MAG: phosphoribosyl-AMP cyclohydrolase [Betaproteobacteria bacterium HGW-Betaproteobacteria-13]
MSNNNRWLNDVKWDENGLVPVIAQEASSGDVLMFAWMKLWHKGEESGHVQKVLDIRIDCDNDVVLLKIEQVGGIACHTGRHSCFFQKFFADGRWEAVEPVLKDPKDIYQ